MHNFSCLSVPVGLFWDLEAKNLMLNLVNSKINLQVFLALLFPSALRHCPPA